MKRMLVETLLIPVSLLFVACGGDSNNESSNNHTSSENVASSQEDTSKNSEKEKGNVAEESNGDIASEAKSNGLVLVDNESIIISYTGQSNNLFMGAALNVEVENKTDSTITVQAREVSIDGYMAEPIFSCDVAAGKKAKDSLTFMPDEVSELKKYRGDFPCVYY